MKRLYLRDEFRGKGIGKALVDRIISISKEYGYERMRLDTIYTMKEAISIYKKIGFEEIKPYRVNPIEGVIYLELSLV